MWFWDQLLGLCSVSWVVAEGSGSSVLLMFWVLVLMFFNQVKGSFNLLRFKQKQEKDLKHNIIHTILLLILYIIHSKWLLFAFYAHMFYTFLVFCTLYVPDSTCYMTKMYFTYERQYFVNFSDNSDTFLWV